MCKQKLLKPYLKYSYFKLKDHIGKRLSKLLTMTQFAGLKQI